MPIKLVGTICKDKPLPSSKATSPVILTLQAMKKGDYILLSDCTTAHAHQYAKRAGVKITTRKQIDGNLGVWRIK